MDDKAKQLIQNFTLLNGLSPRHKQAFLNICRPTTADRGETLYEHGQSSNRLFILLEGKLEIAVEDGTVVTHIDPVTTVGEMGFISRRPRSATVRASEDSHLFIIEYHDFEALVENNFELSSRIYRNTVRVLYDKLSNANNQIVSYKKHYETAEELTEDEQAPAATQDPEAEPAHEPDEEPAEKPQGEKEEGEGDPVPAADPVPVDEKEIARLVLDFYALADLEVDPEQLKLDKVLAEQLCRDGYTSSDIDYAIRWTIRNIPATKRFNMVKLSIREAFEHKWDK